MITIVSGVSMQVSASPITPIGGDGDAFLDNCETARFTVTVVNNGTTPLNHVRVTALQTPTAPTSVIVTPIPSQIAGTLASCATATLTLDLVLHGAGPDQVMQVLTTVNADELMAAMSFGAVAKHLESDFTPVTTQTFDFDTDFNGWVVTSGTFTRVTPSFFGSTGYQVNSSSLLNNQCDTIDSPLIRLQSTATLSMNVRHRIEPFAGEIYDRANVGVVDDSTGTRTTIIPFGGHTYNAPPGTPNGVCVTQNQAGWYDAFWPGSMAVAWAPADVNPGGAFNGLMIRIQVAYGTDVSDAREGFEFDNVIITNFDKQVADTQVCP